MKTRTAWRSVAIAVACILALLATASCSSMAGKMAGKWQVDGTDATIQFNSGDSLSSSVGPGTYRSVNSTHVKLALPDAGIAGMKSGEYTVSFPTADTMTLVDAAGVSFGLTRVK